MGKGLLLMIVLVCGSRKYENYDKVKATLDPMLHDIDTIVEGGARGADEWAGLWARQNKDHVNHRTEHAKWGRYGLAAGPIRNQTMLTKYKPDLVIAFGTGRGTEDMVKRAIEAGVIVKRIDPPR